MRFRLLRHASLLVEIAGKKILVDPMLSPKEAMDPVQNAVNSNRIPMVELPLSEEELKTLLTEIDAVVITHTHRDHWDTAAQNLIDKNKLLICQPADESKLKEQGFAQVQVVGENWNWAEIKIHRTNGQHGTGEIGKKMGEVSGFVLDYKKDRLYIAGDTIWCNDVREAITAQHPTHIIINGGGARFLQGDPITMTTDDMIQVAQFSKAPISVVHLETVNHCNQRRSDFRTAAEKENISGRINIPADGEWLEVS